MGKSTKTPVSFRATDAQLAAIKRLSETYGGPQAVFDAALAALDSRSKLSKAELMAELDRRIK